MLAAATLSLPEAVHDLSTPGLLHLLDEKLDLESTRTLEAPLSRAVPALGSLEPEVSTNGLVPIQGDTAMGSKSCELYRLITSRPEHTTF